MKLSPRDLRALGLGAGALLVILATRFAVSPWIDSWTGARQAAAADRRRLEDLAGNIRKVVGQRRRLEKAYGPGVNRPLEDAETARISLLAVQDVLKAAGFQPAEVEPRPSRQLREVPGAQVLALGLKGKCKLPQLAKCLAALREAKTLVFVDRLTVTNNEKKPGDLEVAMTLAALAEKPKQKVASKSPDRGAGS